jgi:Flp pilus assembly pilin Flp
MTLSALRRDTSGATIIEFALILPVLSMLMLGVLDLGYRSYVTSVIQGSLHEAARMATVGGISTSTIEARVADDLRHFSPGSTVTTSTRSYFDFNGVSTPETITQDTAPVGEYNPGDCFEDVNGNGQFDLDRGRGGLGNAEDVVHFEVTMTYPRIVPIGGFIPGWDNDVTVTQNTVLRNQPFAGRNTATTVVCS